MLIPNWIEVHIMASSTSSATIENVQTTFARWGIPQRVVTNNGSCFVSAKFKQFFNKNGICQLTSAPYHPVVWPKEQYRQWNKVSTNFEKGWLKIESHCFSLRIETLHNLLQEIILPNCCLVENWILVLINLFTTVQNLTKTEIQSWQSFVLRIN